MVTKKLEDVHKKLISGQKTAFLGAKRATLEKGYFFFALLCPLVARTWFRPISARFFGPENLDFGARIRFFAIGLHCLLRLLSPEACWKKAKSRRKVNGLENGYSYQKEEILERQETICLCVLSYNFQMVFVRKGKAYNMQKHSRVINVLHKFYYYICEILKLSVQDAHIVRCT